MYAVAIPHTTRPRLEDEESGKDYHFISVRGLDDVGVNVWHSGARATSGCCSLHAGQQAPLDDMNVLVCASLPADSDPPVPPAPIATFVATAPAIQRETMEGQIKANMYLEHGEYQGHLYGTNVQSIVAELQKGRTCILDVHPKILPRVRNSTLQPIIVLVIPPSLSRLQQARGTTMYVITGVSFGSSGDWGPRNTQNGLFSRGSFADLCGIVCVPSLTC